MNEERTSVICKVVVNEEGQHSIWPAERQNPPGWNDVGKVGQESECLEFIKEAWTDMRPLSLRRKMENQSNES